VRSVVEIGILLFPDSGNSRIPISTTDRTYPSGVIGPQVPRAMLMYGAQFIKALNCYACSPDPAPAAGGVVVVVVVVVVEVVVVVVVAVFITYTPTCCKW
jgi:hypothetical protein